MSQNKTIEILFVEKQRGNSDIFNEYSNLRYRTTSYISRGDLLKG